MRGASNEPGFANSSAADIKRGLEKIKLAQIEVLRELRKQEPESSRNVSLTYSKDSAFNSKSIFKFSKSKSPPHQSSNQKQSSRKSHENQKTDSLVKKMQQEIEMCNKDLTKTKAKLQKSQQAEERAIQKAQQSMKLAIQSEKKYITLRDQYHKLTRQNLQNQQQIIRLQCAQLQRIVAQDQAQDESRIHSRHKLAKYILDLQQAAGKYFEITAKGIKNNIPAVDLAGTNNQFADNFRLKISAIISCLKNQADFSPIVDAKVPMFQNIQQVSHNYLSGSFREDIRKIQEELDQQSRSKLKKISELQNQFHKSQSNNLKIQTENRELKAQNAKIKAKLSDLIKQNRELDLQVKITKQDYEKLKFQQKKVSDKTAILKNQPEVKSNQSKILKETIEKVVNLTKELKQKSIMVDKIEKQKRELGLKLQRAINLESNYKNLLEKYKDRLAQTERAKSEELVKINCQLNELKARAYSRADQNIKYQHQWNQMVMMISRLREEVQQLKQANSYLQTKINQQKAEHSSIVQDLKSQLKSANKQISALRAQNVGLLYDHTDLQRLRTKQSQTAGLQVTPAFHELWAKKEQQYQNIDALLVELCGKATKVMPQRHSVHAVLQNQHAFTNIQAPFLGNAYRAMGFSHPSTIPFGHQIIYR